MFYVPAKDFLDSNSRNSVANLRSNKIIEPEEMPVYYSIYAMLPQEAGSAGHPILEG